MPVFATLAVLAVPAAALASHEAAGDGTLVINKNASAPAGTPVVVLKKFTGTVIGQTTDQSWIVIDSGVGGPTPEVTGASGPSPVKGIDTAQRWSSPDGFKFRAVGGTFTILIYGSGVNLVAVGHGTAVLAGTPDSPADGRYSINGGDFLSMPGTPTKQLIVGDNS